MRSCPTLVKHVCWKARICRLACEVAASWVRRRALCLYRNTSARRYLKVTQAPRAFCILALPGLSMCGLVKGAF